MSDTVMAKGDIGVKFLVNARKLSNGNYMDISDMITLQFIFLAPSGVTKTKTAIFTTDGDDSQFEYTTGSGDIDEAEEWEVEGRLAKSGFDKRSVFSYKFTVRDTLT